MAKKDEPKDVTTAADKLDGSVPSELAIRYQQANAELQESDSAVRDAKVMQDVEQLEDTSVTVAPGMELTPPPAGEAAPTTSTVARRK